MAAAKPGVEAESGEEDRGKHSKGLPCLSLQKSPCRGGTAPRAALLSLIRDLIGGDLHSHVQMGTVCDSQRGTAHQSIIPSQSRKPGLQLPIPSMPGRGRKEVPSSPAEHSVSPIPHNPALFSLLAGHALPHCGCRVDHQ